ncbi:class IV adenylate cyclase [Lagierella sp.]|uniref:class IV adenylate cyclase n=1 Tax=Lagierella sp. TaxID=2849657 RepID=UPI0026040ED0|nr:class IV adenylate cyclase [Lagierella sp.]
MEKELEIKILNIDFKELESLLIAKGAEKIAHEDQQNIIVSSDKLHFENKGDYLRIRIVKDLLSNNLYKYLTLKRLKDNSEFRESEEYTIRFDDLENLKVILKNLGYGNFESNFKERYSYKYKNLRVDFDYWDKSSFPFDYVEVEALTRSDLDLFLKEFKISKENTTSKSIKELKEEYFKGI